MSMNKDLVAQAVAAIPLWMAFLDEKEAEQDALIEQMQSPKKPGLMDKTTSFLKKKKDGANQAAPSAAVSGPPLSLEKSSTDDPKPKDDIRWAPTEEPIEEEPAEEELTKEEREANQIQGYFKG